jgi:hypothetical protein
VSQMTDYSLLHRYVNEVSTSAISLNHDGQNFDRFQNPPIDMHDRLAVRVWRFRFGLLTDRKKLHRKEIDLVFATVYRRNIRRIC